MNSQRQGRGRVVVLAAREQPLDAIDLPQVNVGMHRPQPAQEAPQREPARGPGADHAQEVRERLEHLAQRQRPAILGERRRAGMDRKLAVHTDRVEVDVIPLGQALVECPQQSHDRRRAAHPCAPPAAAAARTSGNPAAGAAGAIP